MQNLEHGFVKIHAIKEAMTSQKFYDAISFSVRPISTSPCYRFCFSIRSTRWRLICFSGERCKLCEFTRFCILVTWLTKYHHGHQNWRQSLTERTWAKTKPRILRKPKIRRLEVICSNHFVVKGVPLKTQNFQKFAKFKGREIYEPQNRNLTCRGNFI